MFDHLMESEPEKVRSGRQMAGSVVLHTLFIGAAVQLTRAAAETRATADHNRDMTFVTPAKPPPPPPPDTRTASAPLTPSFSTLVPPKSIPTEIPRIDLHEQFDPKRYLGIGVERPDSMILQRAPTIEAYTALQVDDPVQYVIGPAPRYPPALRASGIQGRVTLRFVVDTLGRAEVNSLTVVTSSNRAFEEPAIEAVLLSKFRAARVRGVPVRQLVEQSVRFAMNN